jgi:hypothetical protein
MKLLTYDTGSGPRCGALQDEYVIDVSALLEPGALPIEEVKEPLSRNTRVPLVP